MLIIRRRLAARSVIIGLSGRIRSEHLPQLLAQIAAERGKVVLDLKEVSIVGPEVVNFLAERENEGIVLRNCPRYIRSWVRRARKELAR